MQETDGIVINSNELGEVEKGGHEVQAVQEGGQAASSHQTVGGEPPVEAVQGVERATLSHQQTLDQKGRPQIAFHDISQTHQFTALNCAENYGGGCIDEQKTENYDKGQTEKENGLRFFTLFLKWLMPEQISIF